MANYNSQLQSNNTDLQTILNIINELPEAGCNPVLQDKTITPTTSKQTITADNGYDGLDTVTVNAMPTATQATPTVTINSSGLITATATQTAGYVTAGTKSATKQLAFQAAKTITPSTTSQTAVSSGYYTGGNITVAGDSNLVAGNIKNGTTIFGVTGTYEGSGGSGGDTSMEDGLITRNITTYTNDRVTTIGNGAFYLCSSLTSVNFPVCVSIGSDAFNNCSRLTSVSFPACRTIGSYAFYSCYKLRSVSFPACTTIGSNAFYSCQILDGLSFPACRTIMSSAFYSCRNLGAIYLGASVLCTLANSNAFYSTYIGSTTGSIFVRASLVDAYKSATNWTYFSNRIFSYAF